MKILIIGYDYFHYAQSIVNACNLLGHEATRIQVRNFSEVEKSRWKVQMVKLGFRSLEKEYEKKQEQGYIDFADSFQPDICIVLNGNCVRAGFLSAMQARGVKLVLFMIDSLQEKDYKKFSSQLPYYNEIYSYESTDKDAYPEMDIKYLFIGYDETIFYPESECNNKNIDISFVGLLDKNRLAVLEKVAEYAEKHNKNFFIHTKPYKQRHLLHKIKNHFKREKFKENYPYLSKFLLNSSVCNEDLADVYRNSKICINIHKDHGSHTDANPRTFEILGCHSFQLVDTGHLKQLKLESGKHLIEFCNANDLCKKIDYYLKHSEEREQIASAGYEFAFNHYRMRSTMKILLED